MIKITEYMNLDRLVLYSVLSSALISCAPKKVPVQRYTAAIDDLSMEMELDLPDGSPIEELTPIIVPIEQKVETVISNMYVDNDQDGILDHIILTRKEVYNIEWFPGCTGDHIEVIWRQEAYLMLDEETIDQSTLTEPKIVSVFAPNGNCQVDLEALDDWKRQSIDERFFYVE